MMKLQIVLAALAVTALSVLTACSHSEDESDPTRSSADEIRAIGCGPVDFTGEGWASSVKEAFDIADKDARERCASTDIFCRVDCYGAPVTAKECSPTAVDSDEGVVSVSWSCSVTISASSPDLGDTQADLTR